MLSPTRLGELTESLGLAFFGLGAISFSASSRSKSTSIPSSSSTRSSISAGSTNASLTTSSCLRSRVGSLWRRTSWIYLKAYDPRIFVWQVSDGLCEWRSTHGNQTETNLESLPKLLNSQVYSAAWLTPHGLAELPLPPWKGLLAIIVASSSGTLFFG